MPDLTRAEQLANIPPAALAIYAAELEEALIAMLPMVAHFHDDPMHCDKCDSVDAAVALLAKYGRTAP